MKSNRTIVVSIFEIDLDDESKKYLVRLPGAENLKAIPSRASLALDAKLQELRDLGYSDGYKIKGGK